MRRITALWPNASCLLRVQKEAQLWCCWVTLSANSVLIQFLCWNQPNVVHPVRCWCSSLKQPLNFNQVVSNIYIYIFFTTNLLSDVKFYYLCSDCSFFFFFLFYTWLWSHFLDHHEIKTGSAALNPKRIFIFYKGGTADRTQLYPQPIKLSLWCILSQLESQSPSDSKILISLKFHIRTF